jgi:hypothetical protein
MKEIKLIVDEKNEQLLLSILGNLKEGLIHSIKSESSKTSYEPQSNKVVLEEESHSRKVRGKYVDPAAYKERLKKGR